MNKILLTIILLFSSSMIYANEHIVNLTIAYKTVNFANKERKAIAVNNQIPAPTLHFKKGDHIKINVYNNLDQDTAVHWHGILVPWQMDGVEGVNQKGIPPGGVFQYEFTLEQSGTYWYHAHAGLQEQQGLYGAFLIDPSQPPSYDYTKDFVVVLSDWSNTNPNQILSNLKKEGDYYSPRFPLQPSLMKFIHDYNKASNAERKSLINDYKMMQEMRMSIYDISDVAYDAFLLNGRTKLQPWVSQVNVGDIVRLRFIGAGGATIFRVKIPNTSMQMVHVEGNDVSPYPINDFTIAPGETYDVLIKITKNEPYIIYAESLDTVGAAYGALLTSSNQLVNYKDVAPFPEPLPVTREMMSMMMNGMKEGSLPHPLEKTKTHSNMSEIKKSSNSHSMKDMNKESMPVSMSMSHETQHGANHESMIMNHTMPMAKENNSVPKPTTIEKPTEDGGNETLTTKTTESPEINVNHNHSNMPEMEMSNDSHSMHKMPNAGMNSMSSMNHTSSSQTTTKSHNMGMNSGTKMEHHMSMDHSNMSMPTESTIIGDSISPPHSIYKTSIGTKYDNLVSTVKTNDPNKPVAGVINMELFGYMERFIWFINGIPEYKAHPITLEPGKRYRFVFTNTSMMHHPMHIHGHWFILRKGNDAYDPLLHTIDVPPGATITADVDTDASGQWFFHCHLLYHMMTGMSRTFQYSSLIEITKDKAQPENIIKNSSYHNRPIVRVDEIRPIDTSLVHHPMAHPPGLWLATFLDVGEDPFNNVQRLTYKGLYGPDYNKLELFVNDAEMSKGTVESADIDIFYWRLISQFWSVKGGANYTYRPTNTPYWQPGIGVEGLIPYFIDTDIRGYFHSGSAKLDAEFSRDTQITNNFFIRAGIRSILATKTVTEAEIGSGLNQMRYTVRPYYRLMPGLDLVMEYEHEQYYGAFKNFQKHEGESASQNTVTFGLSFLF